MTKHTHIGLLHNQSTLPFAVYGLQEVFERANQLCQQQAINHQFHTHLINPDIQLNETPLQVLIIPPNNKTEDYLNPSVLLKNWILQHHRHGTIICSVCAGAFTLATTGLLAQRPATTHWMLEKQFKQTYPAVQLDVEKILINDNDIITTGGLMSWVDLGLELVAQFTHPSLMQQLGRYLIIDTGRREQRYYQRFTPKLDHGNKAILKAQHYLQAHFYTAVAIKNLAQYCHLSERTFLRQFSKATGIKPKQYLQKLRIQKACELLETRCDTIESIALQVGYEDSSALRKGFIQFMGLTPKAFKARFSQMG